MKWGFAVAQGQAARRQTCDGEGGRPGARADRNGLTWCPCFTAKRGGRGTCVPLHSTAAPQVFTVASQDDGTLPSLVQDLLLQHSAASR